MTRKMTGPKRRERIQSKVRTVPETIEQQLDAAVGLVIRNADVADLARSIRKMSPARRSRVLELAAGRASLPQRLFPAAAQLLVALLPVSAERIRRYLRRRRTARDYELHFSLFCFLDQAPEVPGARAFARRVPAMLRDYLMSVPSGTAYAAWMAGDLLGDHWEPSAALPVLLDCARSARYSAGREGALHGLAHLSTRVPPQQAVRIRAVLRDVLTSDRSASLRFDARSILEGRHVCATRRRSGRTAIVSDVRLKE